MQSKQLCRLVDCLSQCLHTSGHQPWPQKSEFWLAKNIFLFFIFPKIVQIIVTPLAQKRGVKFASVTILVIWIVSCLLAIPALVYSQEIDFASIRYSSQWWLLFFYINLVFHHFPCIWSPWRHPCWNFNQASLSSFKFYFIQIKSWRIGLNWCFCS